MVNPIKSFLSAHATDSHAKLTPAEFKKALKSLDPKLRPLTGQQFTEIGTKDLGWNKHHAQEVFKFLEHNGRVSVAALQEQLWKGHQGQPLTSSQLKEGVNKLRDRSEQKIPMGKLDFQQFQQLSHKAGITDPRYIRKYFHDHAEGHGKNRKIDLATALGSNNKPTEPLTRAAFKRKVDEYYRHHHPKHDTSTQGPKSGSCPSPMVCPPGQPWQRI